MAHLRGGGPARAPLGLLLFLLFVAGIEAHFQQSAVLHRSHRLVRLRSERLLASVQAGGAPKLPPPSGESSSRVYHVTKYGADPTGRTDSTAAILRALSDALSPPSNRSLYAGIADLGGAEINLDGGSYLISRPITFSSPAGNLKIQGGSLSATDDFPTDRYLIELWSSPTSTAASSPSGFDHEYVTLVGLMLDANYRAGGVAIVNSLRTVVDGCYIVHFATEGIWVQNGHETLIVNSFLGQHITAGGDPGERRFTGTAIRLNGNDNAVTNVVVFSAAVGILVAGQANVITGVHCYNKATGFGGTGIYLRLPGLTQTRILNCYLDYTAIVSEDPVQLTVSNSFFLGNGNVVLKSVNGVMSGVEITGNTFAGSGGVDIVRLDEAAKAFATVDQVVVERNSVRGMTARSTAGKATKEGNGTIWAVDFSGSLLFPDKIDHVQYSMWLQSGTGFANHALTNVSGNQVVIQSNSPVRATVYVAVSQFRDSMAFYKFVRPLGCLCKAFLKLFRTLLASYSGVGMKFSNVG